MCLVISNLRSPAITLAAMSVAPAGFETYSSLFQSPPRIALKSPEPATIKAVPRPSFRRSPSPLLASSYARPSPLINHSSPVLKSAVVPTRVPLNETAVLLKSVADSCTTTGLNDSPHYHLFKNMVDVDTCLAPFLKERSGILRLCPQDVDITDDILLKYPVLCTETDGEFLK